VPTYAYKCDAGHTQEIFHPITESPEFHCDCGELLKKTYSSSLAVSFKGEGFYSTDKNK
jgi:putative FmdB family regulatory protein